MRQSSQLLIIDGLFWIVVLIGYFYLIFLFFRRGEASVGLVCLLSFLVFGCGLVVGIPLALFFGWARVKSWDNIPFMTLWSTAFLAASCFFVGIVVLKGFGFIY